MRGKHYTTTRLLRRAKHANGPTTYAATSIPRWVALGHASAPAKSGRPCQLQKECTRVATAVLRQERKTAAAIEPKAVV